MILIDVNVLLYAYHPRAPQHESCRSWLQRELAGEQPVALCWIVVLAFLRLSTSPRVFDVPLTLAEAATVVSGWLSRPQVVLIEPGERHWDILQRVMVDAQVSGPLVTDAEIAALALEHGCAVCTTDRDFRRFSGLRLIDPLAA
jgi:toxin-antitoxin system PIN domain toxin